MSDAEFHFLKLDGKKVDQNDTFFANEYTADAQSWTWLRNLIIRNMMLCLKVKIHSYENVCTPAADTM